MPQILLNLTDDSEHRVFADPEFMRRLHYFGEVTRFNPKTDDPGTFAGLVTQSDAMLTCWGSRPLKAEDLNGGTRPADKPLLVAHAAGSVRGVVPKELLAQNVRLTQGAPAIALAVAHYTVGLMILALRQAVYRMSVLRESGKGDNRVIPYYDLQNVQVGLVGLSRVGALLVPLLKPFGCQIFAYDPFWTPERARALGVELVADLDELVSTCQVVSLHAPVTPETQNIIDARRVGLLMPGCAFINTARAQLTDQDALFARAIKGEIEVYVDVTTPEPLPPDHPAWQSPHIFITPHIAGPTQQTLHRMADYAVGEVERFLSGEPLAYEVTMERYDALA